MTCVCWFTFVHPLLLGIFLSMASTLDSPCLSPFRVALHHFEI
uniref:Uncharacterized protein n=1 Tax=Arundo donax TaxID=35708 RepID=A0A0A9D0Z9_ARUDO